MGPDAVLIAAGQDQKPGRLGRAVRHMDDADQLRALAGEGDRALVQRPLPMLSTAARTKAAISTRACNSQTASSFTGRALTSMPAASQSLTIRDAAGLRLASSRATTSSHVTGVFAARPSGPSLISSDAFRQRRREIVTPDLDDLARFQFLHQLLGSLGRRAALGEIGGEADAQELLQVILPVRHRLPEHQPREPRRMIGGDIRRQGGPEPQPADRDRLVAHLAERRDSRTDIVLPDVPPRIREIAFAVAGAVGIEDHHTDTVPRTAARKSRDHMARAVQLLGERGNEQQPASNRRLGSGRKIVGEYPAGCGSTDSAVARPPHPFRSGRQLGFDIAAQAAEWTRRSRR